MPRLRRHTGALVVRAAEAIGAWWRDGRRCRARVLALLGRLGLIGACVWVAFQLELPLVGPYLPMKNIFVCLVAVLLIGKSVYDTLYYDRYRK